MRVLSGNDPICHSQKFQPSQTPHSHFLPISPRFLTNIRCRYFSLNIWVVYDQLELDWCIFDQNWAKTRPLHFQIFQIPNAIDRPIVQWIPFCPKAIQLWVWSHCSKLLIRNNQIIMVSGRIQRRHLQKGQRCPCCSWHSS